MTDYYQNKLVTAGRIFFALAIIGLGCTHFLFDEFMTGRAPAWPEFIPGKLVWAYSSGILIILTGALIILGKKARFASIFAAILLFFWALLRYVPIIAVDSFFAPAWTSAGKALTLTGGMLLVASTFPAIQNRDTLFSKFMGLKSEFILIGSVCLGIFLLITGVQHFIFTEFVASLIPGWFPGDTVFWTYFGGVALIAGGAGLLIAKTRQPAALLSGLMVFSWFWIIHIPRTFSSISDGIAVFEALAVSGIAFVIAGSKPKASIKFNKPE